MKIKINKTQFTSLTPFLQPACSAAGDEYEFDTDKVEDPVALKQAKDRERDEHKITKASLKTLEAEHATTKTELETYQGLAKDNIPKANMEALEKSYKDQIAKAKSDGAAEKTRLEKSLHTLLVDNKAQELANEISTSPVLMLPHIKGLLGVEVDSEGNAHTRVMENGKPSAKTLDDLKKDLVANKDFSAIIKATKSKGSGASNGNPASRAAGEHDGTKPFNPNTAPLSGLKSFLESRGVGSDAGAGE